MKLHILARGFLCATLLFCALACDVEGSKKTFNGVELYYTDTVSGTEADTFLEFLKSENFADGNEKTIQLNKRGNTYEIKMVGKKGIENDPEHLSMIKLMGAVASARAFSGAPVDIHICDDSMNTVRVVPMTPGLGANIAPDDSLATKPPTRPPIADVQVRAEASESIKAYEANEIAADGKYQRKTVAVTGIIDSIGKDLSDEPFVILGAGGDFELIQVQCALNAAGAARAASLTKGKKATFVGRVSGLFMNVQMQDCQLE